MVDKTFSWSEEKKRILKNSRDISFEDIVSALESDGLLDIVSSPTHKEQLCFVVLIDNYVYIVPFVEDEQDVCFLKTIYPSRKYTKYYLKDKR